MGLIESDPYRFGSPGYSNNPPTQEYETASAMLEAARLIRDIAYQNNNTQEIDQESMALLIATYHALKPAVIHYWGEQGSLFCEDEPEPATEQKPKPKKSIGLPFRKVQR